MAVQRRLADEVPRLTSLSVERPPDPDDGEARRKLRELLIDIDAGRYQQGPWRC
jgi:hypothetical protein